METFTGQQACKYVTPYGLEGVTQIMKYDMEGNFIEVLQGITTSIVDSTP